MKWDLLEDVYRALKDRTEWEERQVAFYRMRHQGLRRKSKPYPNAPDMHFPLADASIEKLKPFYFQQLYATETFATFISLRAQDSELTSSVGSWFDYKLKQQSNLEREILCGIDHMEMSGSSVLKLFWDAGSSKRLVFDARDPLHIIVPQGTSELSDADWLIDVIQMSESQYKANPEFKQDPDFIKSIKGKDTSRSSAYCKDSEVARREGLTVGQDKDQIVLWEVYRRDGDKITVQTISPLWPDADKLVRPDFTLPYNLGAFSGGKSLPFARFRMEIKDKGWYSPRGVTEIVAPFEASLCKTWNSKHEWMDFFNRPTYSSERDLGSASNIKQLPGQILPPGVTPNVAPTPPVSFDEEMQSTRALAEYRLQIPDLGAAQHLTDTNSGRGGGGKVTATQINAIVGQSGQGDDMRARIFRLDLADVYRLAWGIYLQFDKTSLDYIVNDQLEQITADALHEEYLIIPNGSADSWNKGLQLQKAVTRFQMFKDDPWINQGELRKTILESDDPKLVKRLFQDPQAEIAQQMEVQAQEISIMLLGFPAQVNPSDDDKAHLQSMGGFIQRRVQAGEQITPEFARLMLGHGGAHDEALKEKGDKQAQQIRGQMMPVIQFLSQVAQSDQAPPQNVIAGPGAPAMLPQAQGQGPQKPATPPDPIADASKLMTSLAALLKAGAPIGVDQLNAALADGGLPAINLASAIPQQPEPQQMQGAVQP